MPCDGRQLWANSLRTEQASGGGGRGEGKGYGLRGRVA